MFLKEFEIIREKGKNPSLWIGTTYQFKEKIFQVFPSPLICFTSPGIEYKSKMTTEWHESGTYFRFSKFFNYDISKGLEVE